MPIFAVFDLVDDSRLEVNQDCPGDVVLIIRLVKEDVFAIFPVDGVVSKSPVCRDPVLFAQRLPESLSN